MSRKNKFRLLVYCILAMLLGNACSHPAVKFIGNHSGHDPEIEKYINAVKYMSQGRLHADDMSVGFMTNKYMTEYSSSKGYVVIGVCTFITLKLRREIDINQKYWMWMNDHKRFILVAHELGHCKCGRTHINREPLRDGCPAHYMNSIAPSNDCAIKHFMLYSKQIAKGCRE
jgi:hypothetical protein